MADGLAFDDWVYADQSRRGIVRQLVDGFWRGALVTRWPVLLVDGGKCYLPDPRASVMAGRVTMRWPDIP